MRLLQRTLSAARGLRAAPSPTTCCRRGAVAEHGRRGTFAPQQPRRPLSSQASLEALFAAPGMRRYLEDQAGGGASPQLAARIHQLWAKEQELRDTQELARADENEDLQKLAEEEIVSCQEDITELQRQVLVSEFCSLQKWRPLLANANLHEALLVFLKGDFHHYKQAQREEMDNNDLVMEVTSGVGGQEAMLFSAEIFCMYQQYAAYKNWRFELLEYFPSEIGGLRYAAASILGLEAYKHMKFESGVHRVQRVPKTEKQNRIHTSTMTIAIFPQPKEMNLTIHRKDLQIETKRSGGAGGQHVNKTDSAVRITHIPTGVVAECQQERSQIRNKEKAMQILRARIYNIKLEEETRKRENARNLQIGTKGRSEKIRTYNFPQDRVTDHRINRTVHHIENFMLGKELLDEMIISLRKYADYESLMEIISENEKKKLI